LTNISATGFYHLEEGVCQLDTFTGSAFTDSSRYLRANFYSTNVGAVNRIHWDFGDGDTSNMNNPIHSYQNPGSYEVVLTVYDNYCMKRVLKDSISICPDTISPGFFASSIGTSLTFVDTSQSNAYLLSWDFGDGQTALGQTVNHTYNSAGVYWVCLSLTDSCRTKQYCDSVTVCADTVISNFSNLTNGLQVSFSDSSLNAQSLSWDFGDGSTSSLANPNHTYNSPGYYFVCLTATGICNASVFCDTIAVCLDTAKAGFGWNVTGNLVSFTDSSNNANSYFWDFGDGNFSTQPNPTHFYQTKGTYTVCLAVVNDCFSDTLCQEITLCNFNLNANFTYSSLFSPVAIQFQDASTDAISWFWDFDDGSSSTNQNPVKVFAGGNIYKVCLTVTDSCNATDSSCSFIDLTAFSVAEADIPMLVNLYPLPANDKLTLETNALPISFEIYDMTGALVLKGEQNNSPADISISHLPSGIYMIRLIYQGKVSRKRILIR
jgi:PKD repeat protein